MAVDLSSYCDEINFFCPKLQIFIIFFVCFKESLYICNIACELLVGWRAVLHIEKDVFERLSLCIKNLANSAKPQQTDDN